MDESENNNLTYVIVDRNSNKNNPQSSDNSTTQGNPENNMNQPQDNLNYQNTYQNDIYANEVKSTIANTNDNHDLTNNINYYISVSMLSVMAYMIIAYSSNVGFIELVDLEIPLIIFLSLIIAFLSNNWSRLYTYLMFAAILVVLIGLSFNYSFFFMIVLFSEMVINSLNMIINNKNDYININK